jgi:predicted acetyltransferase
VESPRVDVVAVWQRATVSDYDIRPLEVEERRAAIDAFRAALLSGPVNDETFEAGQASWDDSDSLGAWDGERCVGSVGAFRFDSTVPGGARVQTAGVTRVGVLPTHTRRGLLTRMMHRLLADSRERGNVLATLHASETSIYRRYGFGLASDLASVQVTTQDAKPWRSQARPGSMRLLAYGEVLDVVPALYEDVARWRVGSISRPDWMWKRILKEASEPVAAPYGKGSFVAVHADAHGNDDGYVYYDVDWDDSFATNGGGLGKIRDLWGTSPAVEVELWRYLLGIDLVVRWQSDVRPVDEPVRRAMHDARAYESKARFDDQWVRILDVDAALGARTYNRSDAAAVTIGVDDPMFAANCGVWEISASGAARVDTPADVHVDVSTLSAAYLGAVAWHDLATIGSVATTDDVLDRLDSLFAVRPTPFCGTGY